MPELSTPLARNPAAGQALTDAWSKSPVHEKVDERLHRDTAKSWRPKLD